MTNVTLTLSSWDVQVACLMTTNMVPKTNNGFFLITIRETSQNLLHIELKSHMVVYFDPNLSKPVTAVSCESP